MEQKKLITYISWAFAILLFLVSSVVFAFVFEHKKNASKYYKQGLEYFNKEDYQNAYYNFTKVLPASDVYLNALYKGAKCADSLNDKKTAIKKYSALNRAIKNENISPFVLWRLGKLHFECGENFAARKAFKELKSSYPSSQYGIASNYMLSNLTNNQNEKKNFLIEYAKKSPKGRYAKEVIQALVSNKATLSVQEKIILANCMLEAEEYIQAVETLKEVPFEASWVYLIKALEKLNSSNNVLKVGRKGLCLENANIEEDLLDEAFKIYIKHCENKKQAAENVFKLVQNRQTKALALYYSALNSSSNEARQRKLKLGENFPDTKYAPSVLHEFFMEAVVQNKTVLAQKYAKLYMKTRKDNKLTPSVLYFTASIKKKTLDSSYKDDIMTLIGEFPSSYYTYRAYVSLLNKELLSKRRAEIKRAKYIEFPDEKDKKAVQFFENLASERDFKGLEDFRIDNPIVESWIEFKKGNKALSSVIARDYISEHSKTSRRDPVWNFAYPIYYSDLINEFSKQNGLSPYLILALIKEESHFNSEITSGVGAAGLMQVMPSTAEMISKRAYTKSELLDAKLNISLGTKYFASLMETFSNNEPLCVLSYNSGPNAVKRWLSNNEGVSLDILVESIPYAETKQYIKKVYSAYWNYLLIYEGLKI